MTRLNATFVLTNPLMRLLAVNAAAGSAAALVLVAGLYWFDVGGLQRLSAGSTHPWLPVAMLSVAFIITFASTAMGAAIMLLPGEGQAGNRGVRQRRAPLALQPVPVPVAAARRRR